MVGFAVVHGLYQRRILEEIPILNGFGNAGQFLIDDAAGPDIGMAHFRVAHLAIRKTDVHPGCTDISFGAHGRKTIHIRRIGCRNGVAVFGIIFAIAVHNDQR